MSQPAALKLTEKSILPNTMTTAGAAAAPTTSLSQLTIHPTWTKTQLNVILIGETGTGKTAMLDLLANVCAGVELADFRAAHQTTIEQGGSQSNSQTTVPEFYTIHCANETAINILDTPGLASTHGIDMDNKHKAAIANAIKKHFETIDAVIILANGTNARLGAATEYALTTISGMFPYSIIDNIAFIFTMVSDPTMFNFDQSSLPAQFKNANVWSINNPFAQWQKYQEIVSQEPCTVEDDILEEMKDSVNRSYKKARKTLSEILQFLDKCQVQPTKDIYNLHIMAMELEAGILNVIALIDQMESMRNELQKLQINKADQEKGQKMNEDFWKITNMPFNKLQFTGYFKYNSICITPTCYTNCHENCGIFSSIKNFLFGWYHDYPYESTCKVCRHLDINHRVFCYKWVKEIRTDKVVDEDAKRRHDEAKTEVDRLTIVMESVQKKIRALEQEILDSERKLNDLCLQFNQLALSGSFVGYISFAIKLLQLREEKMKKDGADEESLQRMAERIKRFVLQKQVLQDAEKSVQCRMVDFVRKGGVKAAQTITNWINSNNQEVRID
ncbi:hypothetical protein FB446DRAFT_761032 [Lentinula raphanica]|nr:hypothetical protein FB446DRAFT_761032 [Lentinula raphanica]